MTNFRQIRVLTLILSVFLVASCNQLKLENPEAKELILKELKLPQSHSIFVGIDGNTSGLDALQNAGIITYNITYSGPMGTYLHLTVTDKGKPFYLGKNSGDHYQFKTYETDFGDITGIAINKEDQTATVRFTTKPTNVTPIAKSLSITPYGWSGKKYINDNLIGTTNHEIVFKKFDNGWQPK